MTEQIELGECTVEAGMVLLELNDQTECEMKLGGDNMCPEADTGRRT
jgi:hypothetical protein